MHIEIGKNFANSVKTFDFSTWKNVNYVVENHPDVVRAGADPRENELLFGAIGTIAQSACIVYVATMILKHYGHNIDVVTLATEAAEKGYRSWGFKNYLSKYLITPTIDIKATKEKFGEDIPEVNDCNTIEELEDILGKVTQIGGSAFLVDNVISALSNGRLNPVTETRITSMEKVVENLKTELWFHYG